MHFAFPAVLWALPAALLPLVIHLLSRRRARRVPFSDLAFLRRIQARALARTRLRQWLLVAARCLLLAALIVAYAGPVLRSGAAASGETADALDVVLLLDASYSMTAVDGGRSRFELAREQGAALARSLRAADRVAVGVFTDRLETPPGPLAFGDAKRALEALARAAPTYRPTDYGPAAQAARDLLSADPRRRRAVVLLSDGARHGARAELDLDPAISWLALDWGKPPANAHLASVALARETAGGAPRLVARAGGAGAGGLSVELRLAGRRVESAAARGSGAEAAASLALPAAPPGGEAAWSGEARIRPDALAADDSYFFSFRRSARPRVLVLYGDPAFFRAPNAGYFFKELLGGARESLLDAQTEFAELHRLADLKLSDYQVVVLADAREVPAGAAAALERWVRDGGGLWVLPSASASEGALKALDAWLPASFGPVVSGEDSGLKLGSAADPAAWKGFELERVQFARYFLLQVRAGSRVVFKSPSGYPMLVTGERGRGRVAVWASSLDAGWTNLALKPAFAPWVLFVLDQLAPGRRAPETLETTVGRPIVRVWAADEAAPARVRLRGPDGRGATLFVRDRRVESAPTEAPGLYELAEEGTQRRHVFAVNVDRASGESDLSPLSPAPWKAAPAADLVPAFRAEVFGRDARRGFLAAAAALLLLEMALALPAGFAAPVAKATSYGARYGSLPLAAALLALAGPARAQAPDKATGDRFVWTQLKLGPQWDPYPTAPQEALEMLATLTSVLTWPERRVVSLEDKELFFSPVVVLAGREAPPPLTQEQASIVRSYLSAGGLLWIEDVSGAAASSFDRWVRRELPRALPEAELAPLGPDHVVYKTFFLLKGPPVGRVFVAPSLEGVSWGGRTAVVYSRNDLLGVWPRDALGKPLLACAPGGEPQRHAARKLALNILMYGLTGNYKADVVHQPFIMQKMRSGQ